MGKANTKRGGAGWILAAAAGLGAMAAFVPAARAALQTTVVNDTWQDGTRSDPAAPTYSEYGTDADADGNLESAWFNGGTGATLTSSVGHLVGAVGASSASWTTYFAPESTPIVLANTGDQLKVTWVFTPTNVNATNTNQNFRIGTMDSTNTGRVSGADGAPNNDTYTGYALFANFAQTTGRSTPFQMLERTVLTSSDPLGTSGNWGNAVSAPGFGNGAIGYASGTQYTLVETLTRNASSGLDIVMTMSGGNINGTGSVSVSTTDATPNTFQYDTFAVRPSNNTTTADSFDTTLFKVEGPVPEPSSAALLLGAGAATYFRRRRATR
jgi:hypothetical protein